MPKQDYRIHCKTHGPSAYQGHLMCGSCQLFIVHATGPGDIPSECPLCDAPFSPKHAANGGCFSAKILCSGCYDSKLLPN